MSFERGSRSRGFRLRVFGDAAREVIAAWVVALVIAGTGLAFIGFGDVRSPASVETQHAPRTAASTLRPSWRVEFTCAEAEETAEQASRDSESHREEC